MDKTLKRFFPTDHECRCICVSIGMDTLASREGFDSRMIGGDFGAMVAPRDGAQPWFREWLQNDGSFPHYWNEIEGDLVDPGFSYLSVRTPMSCHAMPIMMWPTERRMPTWARYRSADVIDHLNNIDFSGFIDGHGNRLTHRDARNLIDLFVQALILKYDQSAGKHLDSWLLTGRSDLAARAKAGDKWSKAIRLWEQKNIPGSRDIDGVKIVKLFHMNPDAEEIDMKPEENNSQPGLLSSIDLSAKRDLSPLKSFFIPFEDDGSDEMPPACG